jgi:hypothetical protein
MPENKSPRKPYDPQARTRRTYTIMISFFAVIVILSMILSMISK